MLGIHVDIRGPNSGLGTYSLIQLNFIVIVIVFSTSPDSAGQYADIPRTYGVRRTNPAFWQHSDAIHADYRQQQPTLAAWLDYSRLENR